jgi:hypothetical protein
MGKWSLEKLVQLGRQAKDSTINVWKKTWGTTSDIPSKFEERKLK